MAWSYTEQDEPTKEGMLVYDSLSNRGESVRSSLLPVWRMQFKFLTMFQRALRYKGPECLSVEHRRHAL
ncbi:predicted protein [Histoplasma capsulatum G186AR]|uniref:Uncharacterized protein n=1 Tax=Ajellomyces capsulatus (strain G186AR / H82 / ATCC MYA-2454 / RMSCC 2432) TaxID=447093 RepID=C0NF76_AJECG|nr:uncharacterized protein HCBG_01542 [Histoplasma capsulatum G186AR]EEH09897.1 predicted protein [Histoplasma capsulatum G186AR]